MSLATEAGGDYGRFDRISAAYDAARQEFPVSTIAYVIGHLPARPTVLDLACGTGISSRQLAAKGAKVIGCDVDPLMLRHAVARGGGNIRYLIGRAEAIPLHDGSVDAVACFRAYHWFDPPRALPEIMRVLKREGRLVIANMIGRDGLYNEFRALVSQFVGGELPDHRSHYAPKRDLAAHGLRLVAETVERLIENNTVAAMVAHFETISVWNLIPDHRMQDAHVALTEFCRAKAKNGVIARELKIDTIIAAR